MESRYQTSKCPGCGNIIVYDFELDEIYGCECVHPDEDETEQENNNQEQEIITNKNEQEE